MGTGHEERLVHRNASDNRSSAVHGSIYGHEKFLRIYGEQLYTFGRVELLINCVRIKELQIDLQPVCDRQFKTDSQ